MAAPLVVVPSTTRRRWACRAAVGVGVVAVQACLFGARRRPAAPAALAFETRGGPAASSGGPAPTFWSSSNLDKAATVMEIEEHVASFNDPIVSQAWLVTSQLLFGDVGAAAGVLDDKVGVRATSYDYTTQTDFLEALRAKRLGAGAHVYASVTSLMDDVVAYDELKALGVDDATLFYGSSAENTNEDASWRPELVRECVYTYADDLLLNSNLLRALLAYDEPLTLIFADDLACRTRLPATHHRLIFANDGGYGQVLDYRSRGLDAHWWPDGLEGLEDDGAVDAFVEAVQAAHAPHDRDYLVSYGGSTIFRKPSRVNLGNYMTAGGGKARLVGLGDEAGLLVDLESYALEQQDFGSQSLIHNLPRAVEWTAGAAPENATSYDEISRSYFALAAAGDVWASGRVLEALTLNAVPVVDKTYSTDGGRSAKGCADPASFWESGLDAESPAVFVSDWAQLAPTLTKAGALDADQRDERVARVQPYLRSLADALRSTLLGGHLADRPRTSCVAAPVAPAQRSADLAAAAAYYDQQPPAGVADSSGPYWFDGFVDNPSLPSPNCDPKGVTGASALFCFDSACVPPSASSFECGPL